MSHPVFKPARKNDRPKSAYMYPDGHVVASFERTELGRPITYVKIAQSIGVKISGFYRGTGYVAFYSHAPLVWASLMKTHIALFRHNESTEEREAGRCRQGAYIGSKHGDLVIENHGRYTGQMWIESSEKTEESPSATETWAQVATAETWDGYPVVATYPSDTEESAA